jgi:transporter family protein
MWWIYALLSAFFAALTAIFAKIGVKGIDSDLGTAVRTTVVLVFAWALAFIKGVVPSLQQFTRHTWLFLVLSGMATGLSWLFYFRAIQVGKLSQVAPVDKLSVALTIIFAVLFLGEALTIRNAIGGALIVAGVLVLVL